MGCPRGRMYSLILHCLVLEKGKELRPWPERKSGGMEKTGKEVRTDTSVLFI